MPHKSLMHQSSMIPINHPKFGRFMPIQIVTIFARNDGKVQFLTHPDLVKVYNLNPSENLLQQWEALNLEDKKPDLIVTKMNKAICFREVDSEYATAMKNYEELRTEYESLFDTLEVIPLRSEMILSNRFKMQDFIETVCTAVNITLKCQGGEQLYEVEQEKEMEDIGLENSNDTSPPHIRYSCLRPKSVKIEKGSTVSELPTFPLIVKPMVTSKKDMALVLDPAALDHFRSYVNCNIIVEEYVPHNNTILKAYVIGKDIYIIRRPSLPDILDNTQEALVQFASVVSGEFVSLTECNSGGYVIFMSNLITKREVASRSFQRLDDCKDLDQVLIRLLIKGMARDLQLDLFGVDILVSTQNRVYYIVDVNVFPGYKGLPEANRFVCEFLVEIAARKALKDDCYRMSPTDVLEMSLFYNEEWCKRKVILENIKACEITTNRIYEISFINQSVHPDVNSRHMFVKFRTMNAPKRFITNKDSFSSNICMKLSKLGIGPNHIKNVMAVYYEKERYVCMVRDWIEGMCLKGYFKKADNLHNSRTIFKDIGKNIAQFHLLIHNSEVQSDILKHHFPGSSQDTALLFPLLEEWRADAVLSLLCSGVRKSATWKVLHDQILDASHNLPIIIDNIVKRIKTKEAMNIVFGHFDCNTSNIIISEELGEISTILIDEEWAGPNIAIYDFSKFITSASLMILRGTTYLTMEHLKTAIEIMAGTYLEAIEAHQNEAELSKKKKCLYSEESITSKASKQSAFVEDAWNFVPIAALTNCFSNLIHASKEGQLTEKLEEDQTLVRQKDGKFNWLRHTLDHYQIYQERMVKMNNSNKK